MAQNQALIHRAANNASLMSPSINQSYRANFLNETRLSMQSSMVKGGTTNSVASGSRNLQSQAHNKTINNSVDYQNQMMSMNNSMNNTGSMQNHMSQEEYKDKKN